MKSGPKKVFKTKSCSNSHENNEGNTEGNNEGNTEGNSEGNTEENMGQLVIVKKCDVRMSSMTEHNGIKTEIIVPKNCKDVRKIRNNKIYFNNGNVIKAHSGKRTVVFSEDNIVYEDL